MNQPSASQINDDEREAINGPWEPKKKDPNPGYAAEVTDIVATGNSFSPYGSRLLVRVKTEACSDGWYLDLHYENDSNRLAMLTVIATAMTLRRYIDVIAPTLPNGDPDPSPAPGRIGCVSIGALLPQKNA